MAQKGFFSKFPRIKYPYSGKIISGSLNQHVDYIDVIDITYKVKFSDKITAILNDELSYEYYRIAEGDRLDTIAFYYYGNSAYHWVVLLSASVFDWIYDLPLNSEELLTFTADKWAGQTINGITVSENPTLSELNSTVHHYEVDGYIVDLNTYTQYVSEDKKVVSLFDYEFNENEARRDIKLLKPRYLPFIRQDFDKVLSKVKIKRNSTGIENSL